MNAIQKTTNGRSAGWSTLEELRAFVADHGWLSDDFERAIKAVGNDPSVVANRLQIIEFQRALHGLDIKAAERKRIEQFELRVNLNPGDLHRP
jgi:hypothetical protein